MSRDAFAHRARCSCGAMLQPIREAQWRETHADYKGWNTEGCHRQMLLVDQDGRTEMTLLVPVTLVQNPDAP